MVAQVASRADRYRDDDIARAWARRGPDAETVVLLEPDLDESERLVAGLGVLGVRIRSYQDPFRALARIGVDASLVIVSARIGVAHLTAVAQALRAETRVPVLIAHGGGDLEVIGPAVLAGARPLLALPYEVRDVAAVVRAETPAPRRPPKVQVGELSLIPEWFDVHFRGQAIDLSPLEFDLLLALASRDGGVVPRAFLEQTLWSECRSDPKYLLGAAVKRIRLKLAPLGIDQAVQTVRNVGYRLEPRFLTG